MGRLLFAKGARGELVRRAQARLKAAGLYDDVLDGDYGQHTADAVKAFCGANGLPAAQTIDVPAWKGITTQPVPGVRDRVLQVTAAFEGHGFTLAQGNFDGAGITWGIIGFTLAGGELARLLLDVQARHPDLLRKAFGPKTDELLGVMRAPATKQIAFANANSLGASKERLAEPWRSGFAKLGSFPKVQQMQLERVDSAYFKPARQTAAGLGLKTELGLALAFDVHVQNGSIRPAAAQEIAAQRAAHPIHKERELRIIVAHAVANASKPAFRADVLSRKLTMATGAGVVHGATYVLRNWGVDEIRVG